MADYSQLKVPDLKKILQERGLAISGNKADLIARLTDADKKSGGAAGMRLQWLQNLCRVAQGC
jgi:SAP domain-containing ribonucleoprotein